MEVILKEPEVTEDYVRIPVANKEEGDRIRTITISEDEGIKALYAGNRKVVLTYIFAKEKDWDLAKAKKWIEDHKKESGSSDIKDLLNGLISIKEVGRILSKENEELIKKSITVLNNLLDKLATKQEVENAER
ncbi:unnamed protein product, partial [marine sediment metagenome]